MLRPTCGISAYSCSRRRLTAGRKSTNRCDPVRPASCMRRGGGRGGCLHAWGGVEVVAACMHEEGWRSWWLHARMRRGGGHGGCMHA